MDDIDGLGIGSVKVDQLPGLIGGVRHEPGGGGNDLFLADDTHHRLRDIASREFKILHLRHGVH